MRRRWRRMVAALLVLAVVAAWGWLLRTAASTTEFTAGALTQLLGRPVELESARLRIGPTLEIEIRELRIFEEGQPEPVFRVRQALGNQSWPNLLAGRLLPTRWRLETPVLVLAPTGTGAEAAMPRLPPLDLSVHDGTLEWRRGSGPPLRLENVQLHASPSPLRSRVRGSALGQVVRAGTRLASFAVEFGGWPFEGEIGGRLEAVDLAALEIPGVPPLRGHASGTAELRRGDGVLEGSLDLDLVGFRFSLPGFQAPIAPGEARLAADLRWSDGRLEMGLRPLGLDDIVVSGEFTLDTRPDGRVQGALTVAPFQLGQPNRRLHLLRLMGLRYATWARFDARTEGGWLEDVQFDFDLPRDGMGDAIAFRRKLAPEELRITARARDGVYRPRPESAPLEAIEGELRIEGNRLYASRLRMSRGGKPYPEIDVVVDGMHRLVRLPVEERKTPRGPGVPIPGLGAAFGALQSDATDRPPVVIRLRDFSIGYPAFVLPLRDAEGVLRFPDGNLLLERAHGVLGGAPAELDALWDRTRGRVQVRVVYGDGEAAPPPEPGTDWAEGRFATETAWLGRWRLDDARGHLRAEGSLVQLSDVRGSLAEGPFDAEGHVELGTEGSAPFGFSIDHRDGDAARIAEFIRLPAETLTGRAKGTGTIAGRLVPGRRFLADGEVRIDAEVEGGTLGNLPATIVIARLASPLGWRGLFGRPLPFDQISADIHIREGKLRTEHFSVVGPELRMLAAGEIDLLSTELQTRMMVALLFLQTVDRVIQHVPVVGSWMLGEDRNLVGVYFELEGPWAEPQGRVVPPTALQTATDWAGRVIGVGVRRLRNLLTAGLPTGQGEKNDETSPGQDPQP